MNAELLNAELPVWRSLLYVPANVERYIEKAHTYGADCVQLDLEDSVPASEKARARASIAAASKRLREHGVDVAVRINRSLDLAVRDIEAAVDADVDALNISKVQSATHLQLLDDLVSDLERARGIATGKTRFIATIETSGAFFQMPDIAHATSRLVAMGFGSEDFATELGMRSTEETLTMPKQQMIIAAAGAGLLPLGFIASISNYRDLDAFRAMAQRSRAFGFAGASCVHPTQVPIVNEAYSPTAEEVAEAKRIVAACQVAGSAGRGAFAIDGSMIDRPVVLRAERVIRQHLAIEARETRSRLHESPNA
jgi:citrate lyase subunit beta / citryl-CoA lyase